MADPLSMTASIIAILQLTGKLTSYITEAKNATKEQAKVAMEASNLYGLLTNLRFRVEAAQPEDPWFNQVKLLGTENGPLDQFKSVLEGMVQQLSSSGRKDQIKSILLWKFTRSEIENALTRVERLKTLINCALMNDLFTLSQALHDEVVTIGSHIERIGGHAQRLQTHADQDILDRLSRWLGVPDPSTNYHAALSKRHSQTGLWLLNNQSFVDWKRSKSSLMWLHGNPGCGKTVLSAMALQNLIDETTSLPDTAVSYFYFDFRDVEKQSSTKAIRSIVFQVATQVENGVQDLEKLYHSCQRGQQQPAETAIRSLLKQMTERKTNVYILLDALDECTDQGNLLTFIRDTVRANVQGMRMIATSRRQRDIEDCLNPSAKYNVNIESGIVDEDIRIYVGETIAQDSRLRKWAPSVQDEISSVLMEKAGGMFRWVFCQLEALRECIKVSALRKTLFSLPKTLDETYERLLQNLDSVGQLPDTLKALRWLCFSERPLRLKELAEIIAIVEGADGGFCPEDRLIDPADITTVCSSLVSCIPAKPHIDDQDDEKFYRPDNEMVPDQVQLAHFSVKEYLLSDRCTWQSYFQPQACHGAISEGCLHYLLYVFDQGPMSRKLFNSNRLSKYAASYWWRHARANDCSFRTMQSSLAAQLFMNQNALLSYLQIYNVEHLYQSWRTHLTIDDLAQPLYYAASLGISEVVKKFLREYSNVNTQGGHYGNALQAAARRCNEDAVQALLDAGAEVNAAGGHYGNALQAAARRGNEKVVQILLDAGAEVNARGGLYGNALQAAAARGNAKVMQILLNAGARVNTQGGQFGNALQAAAAATWDMDDQAVLPVTAMHTDEKVVQMLLDAGADVNKRGGFFGNALQAAAASGNETVVQMLLDAGAEANARGGLHGNALQAAAVWRNETVVQMLLNVGANVNAQGGRKGNALQAASHAGAEKVLQMLLDAGAEVNAQGGKYFHALQAATRSGEEKLVQILLDAGAEVNVVGGKFGTAIQAAASAGYYKIVRLLLAAGADVNIRGGLYGSAIRAASCEENRTSVWKTKSLKKTVRILLDAGAVLDEDDEIFTVFDGFWS